MHALYLKGTLSEISSEPLFVEGSVRYPTVPLKPLKPSQG